ncbi:MerR family transcriptional regulator [Caproicibacterium sp. NSD3]
MLIGEVCKVYQITKKAVEYYEQQGFIHPEAMKNGYRNYSNKDISMLKEVSMLRKLDIGIADIKSIVFSQDKCKALVDYQAKLEVSLTQAKAQYDCITHLISNGYDVEETTNLIEHSLDHNTIIRDKLLYAFPGSYGKFLSLHFGRFLNEKIDTTDKAIAYQKIIDYLDSINNFSFPSKLEDFFELMDKNQDAVDFEKMEKSMASVVDDYDGYVDKNKKSIEQYLEIRNSEEYKSSPAFEMQKAMIDFQRSSGYSDIFIPNLKILSKSYTEYMQKLQTANDKFMKRFPKSKTIYEK